MKAIGMAVVLLSTVGCIGPATGSRGGEEMGAANSVTGSCGQVHQVAVTNGVPTTISSPRNTGVCTLTLGCLSAADTVVGAEMTIAPGTEKQSFSCGANAQSIRMRCAAGREGDCTLEYN